MGTVSCPFCRLYFLSLFDVNAAYISRLPLHENIKSIVDVMNLLCH